MRVTVFGGSQTIPGDALYEDAHRLGVLIGSAGHTVLTGGYIGTMEAVSRGASEAGGHVVGVTCDEIETFRPGGCNEWVMEERRFPHLSERLMALIDGCDAALALPGGPGTLAEISLMWNLLLIGAISSRPLILIGPGWETTIKSFLSTQGSYVPERQRSHLLFAGTVENAFEQLQHAAQARG